MMTPDTTPHSLLRESSRVPSSIFEGDPVAAARAIIGAILVVNGAGGIIVETEAYDQSDPASHSFKGLRPSNRSMFGPPGHAYVYRSYGVHWCLNFVCQPTGQGAGVLIRALEPLFGIEQMQARRATRSPRLLCAGPGRLTQALGIDDRHDGLALNASELQVFEAQYPPDTRQILVGPRIGITRAIDQPWRFGLARSGFLSKPFRS
ncbi:DNA-3-methyladenine glycosylase [Orrella marina]|nr:DNA-3-methyladenine glycosylase [Orrella marina]